MKVGIGGGAGLTVAEALGGGGAGELNGAGGGEAGGGGAAGPLHAARAKGSIRERRTAPDYERTGGPASDSTQPKRGMST